MILEHYANVFMDCAESIFRVWGGQVELRADGVYDVEQFDKLHPTATAAKNAAADWRAKQIERKEK